MVAMAAAVIWRLTACSVGASPGFSCTPGIISNSNRSTTASACVGHENDECPYECDDGYLGIGRHVCQSYSTMNKLVLDRVFFGGRCVPFCQGERHQCDDGLKPVRINSTSADGPCLKTRCYTTDDALRLLARGNWEVWQRGRYDITGMYIDHVNPLVLVQDTAMASTDGSGPGLAMECVAASLGYQTLAEAAARVLLTLRSFANQTAGFAIPRNADGWLPTFIDPMTGKCLYSSSSQVGCEYSTDSTAFHMTGVLFAKTYFERNLPQSSQKTEIVALANKLFKSVRWDKLFCSALVGLGPYTAHVQSTGTFVPWLYNSTAGCRDSFGPESDGFYTYSEMHWLAWLAYEFKCSASDTNCTASEPVAKLYRAWEGRASAPNFAYAGYHLLTLWPSYVVQLPYYLVGPFNSDARFIKQFRFQWLAEWAYFNSSSLNAGEAGRYGLGAGPTAAWCAGVGYKADLIVNDTVSQTCRMFSPYAVAGYLPAAPGLISDHLLDLLATGEAVLPVIDTEYIVLWRKSLLDPGWQPVSAGMPSGWQSRDPGYGITLVDFAAELFGLSTLWLGSDFFVQNTAHFTH